MPPSHDLPVQPGTPASPAPPAPGFAMPDWIDRGRDRKVRRPPNLLHAPGDTPGTLEAVGLALQQIALQSVYWLLPVVVGTAFGLEPAEIVGLVCMALVGCALATLLQALPRGAVGSGYAIPSVPTPIFLSAYFFAGALGGSLGEAGAAMLLAALATLVLFLLVPRLLSLIPSDITGLVVFLIGVSLLPRAFDLATIDRPRGLPEAMDLTFFVVVLAAIVGAAAVHWKPARFALLIGGVLGTAYAAIFMPAAPEGLTALEGAALLAVPQPILPEFGGVTFGLFLTFFVATLCLVPDWLGDMTTYQRATDASWTKPDMRPLKRGMVAGLLGVAGSGLVGSFGPSTSSACVGLGIATQSLSRRVALIGAGILVAIAFSPKLVATMLLIPGPVASAMLAYVSAFMAAAGATLIASRVLDARRTCCVGLGIMAGLGVLIKPDVAAEFIPIALVSPVTFGFLVAFGLHLATLPTVMRRVAATVDIGGDVGAAVDRFVEDVSGALGLRRITADQIRHAFIETSEILAGRGITTIGVRVRVVDDVVLATLDHAGEILPEPAMRPRTEDLEGGLDQMEAFAMWLASRDAVSCVRRAQGDGSRVEFEFRD
jgi:NCS2 family nucleobase:cation symporter-2